jgi:hypothetical protein
VVYPKERRMVPKIMRFREWLLAEMEEAIREADGGWGHAEDAAANVQLRVST